MNRYEFLIYLWELTDKYNHHISSEFLALFIADRYINITNNNYTKELAYVVTVISAKINEEGGGLNNIKKLSKLEKEVCCTLNWQFPMPLLIQQLSNVMEKNNNVKIYSDSFILLLRYLQWCNINTNLPTVVLAITILKKQPLPIFRLMKYIKVYNIIQDN